MSKATAKAHTFTAIVAISAIVALWPISAVSLIYLKEWDLYLFLVGITGRGIPTATITVILLSAVIIWLANMMINHVYDDAER